MKFPNSLKMCLFMMFLCWVYMFIKVRIVKKAKKKKIIHSNQIESDLSRHMVRSE